jgi:nucleotide-binding universal stress UspA family protein
VAVVPHEFPCAPGTPEREEALRSQTQDMLVDAVSESDRVHARVVAARSPAQGLHELAESEKADASTCSWWALEGTGPMRRVLLGGVSSGLLRSSPAPVLVVPRSED